MKAMLALLFGLAFCISCAATTPKQRCGWVKIERANWDRVCSCVCEIVLGPNDSWLGMADDSRCKGNTLLTTMECK
jgi:hypothetical protein